MCGISFILNLLLGTLRGKPYFSVEDRSAEMVEPEEEQAGGGSGVLKRIGAVVRVALGERSVGLGLGSRID